MRCGDRLLGGEYWPGSESNDTRQRRPLLIMLKDFGVGHSKWKSRLLCCGDFTNLWATTQSSPAQCASCCCWLDQLSNTRNLSHWPVSNLCAVCVPHQPVTSIRRSSPIDLSIAWWSFRSLSFWQRTTAEEEDHVNEIVYPFLTMNFSTL